jgi:hypothetical protein
MSSPALASWIQEPVNITMIQQNPNERSLIAESFKKFRHMFEKSQLLDNPSGYSLEQFIILVEVLRALDEEGL